MDRFRSGKSLSPLHQAEAYWCALRDGAKIPKRSQIDPRGLENILEYAFILERIAPGIARFRLAGNHLTNLAGMEIRGMPLTAVFTVAARNQISAVLEHVFDAPAVAELTLNSAVSRGRAALDARMILLPLESDFGEISRALGVLVADGPVSDLADGAVSGRAAVRFDLDATILRPVSGLAVEHAFDRVPVPGFAETQTPLSGGAAHLRLVK